jgi:trans-aconitate methyltransferase
LAVADRLLSEPSEGAPLRVLEAGCGDGLLALALAARHPQWEVVGIDLRDDLLEGARRRAAGRRLANVTFIAADLVEELPASGLDAVVALECLSEIPDDMAAVKRMVAALRPGGTLIAQAPDRNWRPVLPGSATTWREQVRQGYDRAGLATLLGAAGLEGVETAGTYRSLSAAAQELRDRIKDRGLLLRLAAFPFLAGAVALERRGLTWGPANAIVASGHRV